MNSLAEHDLFIFSITKVATIAIDSDTCQQANAIYCITRNIDSDFYFGDLAIA